MTISVSIIMKNEEAMLPRCLESCSLFADEIVIVDTGSTDRSIEIAEAHSKVRLFRSEKFNADTHYSDFSFSEAKNEAIRKCQCDWIFWTDVDDLVDGENADKLMEIVRTPGEARVFTFMIAYNGSRFEHCRMFPRRLGIEFDETHACHEYLSIGKNPHTVRRDVTIVHAPGKKPVASNVRNVAIMEKDYNERGRKDCRTMFYLANGYRECERYEEAVDFYARYLKESKWQEERFFARYYRAMCLGKMGKVGDAARECLCAMAEDMRFAEPYCMLGDMHRSAGRMGQAKHFYGIAAEMPFPMDARLFVCRSMYGDYPRAMIQKIEKDADQPDESAPEVAGVFVPPVDRDQAAALVGALSGLSNGRPYGVVPRDDWQREMVLTMDGVVLATEGSAAKEMLELSELPPMHAFEVALRCVGIVPKEWRKMRLPGCEGGGDGTVLVAGEMVGVRGVVTDWLGEIGLRVEEFPDGLFGEFVDRARSASLVVCDGGWASHATAGVGVKTVAVWTDGRGEYDGWEGQDNVRVGGIGDAPAEIVAAARRIMDGG